MAIDDTCTWVFDQQQFKTWKDSVDSKLALLHGIQGCGKSTLLAYLIHEFQKHGTPVLYWFCSEQISSPVTYLRALGYQLLQRFEDKMVIQLLSDRYERTPDHVGTVAAAKGILKDAVLASPSCVIVVDALDEISTKAGDREIFIKALMDLMRDVPFHLKILCSSRNVQRIFDLLSLAQSRVIYIEITPDLIKDDINNVIGDVITKSGLGQRLQKEETVELASALLLKGSQGMFLLPVMMIKDLANQATLPEVFSFLNELPTGLHQYYSTILDRIDSSKLGMESAANNDCYGKRILVSLTWGRANLTITELNGLLSFDHGGTRFLDLESDIKNAFGCLVSVKEDQIKLSHPSVRRYLRKSPSFRASRLFSKLSTPDPEEYLGELCLRCLEKCDIPIVRPPSRFAPSIVSTLEGQYPFLDYASVHWLSHCSAARKPRVFVPQIATLVCSNNSRRLLGWYYAAIHFLRGTEDFGAICRNLQTFVLDLQTRAGFEQMDDHLLHHIYDIDKTLRKMLRFEALWGFEIVNHPSELWTLAPLLENPYHSPPDSLSRQQSLLLRDFVSRASHHGALLDKRHLDDEYDRFLLTDTDVLMWTSLMPCTPYDRRYNAPLDPLDEHHISFRFESIYSSIHGAEERGGKDRADVDSFPASCVLSKDRQHVAVAWPRFSADKSDSVWVKTYLWALPETDDGTFLKFVKWTEASESDPCRADLTFSIAFRKSRLAVAFTEDSSHLWTAGGLYDISNGSALPPPELFNDRHMSELTFAEFGTAVAGLRDGSQLEVYELHPHHCQLRVTARDVEHVLAVSPNGTFTLCLSKSASPVQVSSKMPHCNDEINLLALDGRYLTLWRYSTVVTSDPKPDEGDLKDLPSLEYFYNNGGLQAFSINEAMLVLCVPTVPAWSLWAFDLQASDIVRSAWKVDSSKLLDGADLTSFCFSRTQDRQLYLLDAFGNMRTVLLSGQTASTIPSEDNPLLLSEVLVEGHQRQVYSASIIPMMHSQGRAELMRETTEIAFPEPSYEASLTDIESLSPCLARFSAACLRHFRAIKSKTVVVDCAPILAAEARGSNLDPYTWPKISLGAQSAIEATVDGDQELIEDLGLKPDESLINTTPKINTYVTFDHSVTRGFFHSAIHYPISSERGQPRWWLTMIMDIRSIETPKSRKTGAWRIGPIGCVSQQNLASAYHEENKQLAFSVSLLYTDRAAETASWYLTRLCLCNLAEPFYGVSQADSRGNFLQSTVFLLCKFDNEFPLYTAIHQQFRTYKITADPCIAELKFSPDGRYLYGISEGCGNGVFQFDVNKGRTIRKISISTSSLVNMSLTSAGDSLYLAGVMGPQILQLALPFLTPDKIRIRGLFTGPHMQKDYERLVLLLRTADKPRLAAILMGRNYIRKDGVEGGNVLEPIILTALEEDVEQWTELDATAEEIYDEKFDSIMILKKDTSEVGRSFDAWEARRKKRAPSDDGDTSRQQDDFESRSEENASTEPAKGVEESGSGRLKQNQTVAEESGAVERSTPRTSESSLVKSDDGTLTGREQEGACIHVPGEWSTVDGLEEPFFLEGIDDRVPVLSAFFLMVVFLLCVL